MAVPLRFQPLPMEPCLPFPCTHLPESASRACRRGGVADEGLDLADPSGGWAGRCRPGGRLPRPGRPGAAGSPGGARLDAVPDVGEGTPARGDLSGLAVGAGEHVSAPCGAAVLAVPVPVPAAGCAGCAGPWSGCVGAGLPAAGLCRRWLTRWVSSRPAFSAGSGSWTVTALSTSATSRPAACTRFSWAASAAMWGSVSSRGSTALMCSCQRTSGLCWCAAVSSGVVFWAASGSDRGGAPGRG